jgi:hypothetical protein
MNLIIVRYKILQIHLMVYHDQIFYKWFIATGFLTIPLPQTSE